MKWVTRARPKTDRIACPWLIRRFIDPDAEILYVPTDEVLAVASDHDASASTPQAPPYDHRDGKLHLRSPHRRVSPRRRPGSGPVGQDRARRRHRLRPRHRSRSGRVCWRSDSADSTSKTTTTASWSGPASSTTPSTHGAASRSPAGGDMSGPIGYDDLRADTVRQVAKLMAAAAITAPKSGGQLFLAGKHLLHRDRDRRRCRHRFEASPTGCEPAARNAAKRIWFRDADVAEAIDAVLFVGLADWYPPNYDCGACGYATCAEFLHAHQAPSRRVRRARVRRAHLQPARHRPRHRRRLSSQDRRHPLHRLPVPDPHRCRRPQARPHPAPTSPLRCRCHSPTRPSGSTAPSRRRRRHPRPRTDRNAPRRRARRLPPRRRPEPPTAAGVALRTGSAAQRLAVISWATILYGAALSTLLTGGILALRRGSPASAGWSRSWSTCTWRVEFLSAGRILGESRGGLLSG